MNRRSKTNIWTTTLILAGAAGCAGSHERAVRADLRESAGRFETAPGRGAESPPELDGRLRSYVAYAMRHSPELRARFEQWRAEVLQISSARRLPDPTLSYGYFIRSVETRVGPQRHRLGIRQMFPWPATLTAGADAASLRARAAQRRFEAKAVAVASRVKRVYWRLWMLHRVHGIAFQQEDVLETLERAIQGRVETGDATLADLMQVQLTLTRHRDHHGAHREAMRKASARLVAAIGAPRGTETPIAAEAPPDGLPAEAERALLQAALEHPRIDSHEWMARASQSAARRARARRFPSFGVGLDWIETGAARQPDIPGSGKDPIVANLLVELPLWQGSLADDVEAARAQHDAHLADKRAAEQQARAALRSALADVRDAQRRIQLYETTLLPQSETVHESLRGAYQAGRASVAQLLMSERRLFELREELARARADHARAWARLEDVVGREVERTETDTSPSAPEHGDSR